MALTQDNLDITLTTPLGKDKLIIKRFSGEEKVSGLLPFTRISSIMSAIPIPTVSVAFLATLTQKLLLIRWTAQQGGD